MPGPWMLLGMMIAIGAAFFAGDRHGADEANRTNTIATQQSQLDYSAKLKTAQNAKEAAEHAYNDLKDKTEGQHAKDQADIAAATRRALDAVARGLQVAKRCGDGSFGSVSGASEPVGGNAEGAAAEFYLLPRQSVPRLTDRYAEADNFLSLYRACRTRLLDAIAKSRAPR